MKKWFFNPFIYVAGSKSLLIGWSAMLVTAFIGIYSKTYFDGVLDAHPGDLPLYRYFIAQLIDWGCGVAMLYTAGRIFSASSIRFIDIAGTHALARWVMIFPAFIGFGITAVPDPATHTVKELTDAITPLMIALSLLSTVFLIWMVALMYNAFSVSTNIKGGRAGGIFAIALLVAEIASKIIYHGFFKT